MSDVDSQSIECSSAKYDTKYQEWLSGEESLTKISAILNKPILVYRTAETTTYFILDGETAYIHREPLKDQIER
jgi:hypothetical protein